MRTLSYFILHLDFVFYLFYVFLMLTHTYNKRTYSINHSILDDISQQVKITVIIVKERKHNRTNENDNKIHTCSVYLIHTNITMNN